MVVSAPCRGPGLSRLLTVPSRFHASRRAVFEGDRLVGTVPLDPAYDKDYDSYADSRLDTLGSRHNIENWGLLLAEAADGSLVGGAVVAAQDPSYDLLEGRDDMCHVVDIRVLPDLSRQGVGTALWQAAEAWARSHGIQEIRVETQDVNVDACLFYQAMGCRVHGLDPHAYPDEAGETQVIWSKVVP